MIRIETGTATVILEPTAAQRLMNGALLVDYSVADLLSAVRQAFQATDNDDLARKIAELEA